MPLNRHGEALLRWVNLRVVKRLNWMGILSSRKFWPISIPRCSMYGIFTYMTGSFLGQMLVNIPYMEHMGYDDPYWLVVSTPLKNMKVNGKDYPIYEMENKKCLKPPTSIWWPLEKMLASWGTAITIKSIHCWQVNWGWPSLGSNTWKMCVTTCHNDVPYLEI